MAIRIPVNYTCLGIKNNQVVVVPGATVSVYESRTTTPLGQSLWNTPIAGAAQANPMTADATGSVHFWLDNAQNITISWSAPGWAGSTDDIEAGPGLGLIPDLSGTYQPLSGKGQANGYAGLGADSKIIASQMPDVSGTYQLLSGKNAGNGYLGLDAGVKAVLAPLQEVLSLVDLLDVTGPLIAGTRLGRNDTAFKGTGLRFSAVTYGVVGDNLNASAAANAAALNAAIAAANAAGPGSIVELDWIGVAYTTGSHLIYSRIGYEGRLLGGLLKLANGQPAGTNVMQTASFATLTQTIGGVGAGEYEFMLDKLAIDGNKANNATGGRGVAIYGYGYWTGINVIVNCHAAGFWSEYSDNGEPINTLVGSAHQRACHLGKTYLISNDCGTTAAANTRAAQARAAIGGAQFAFFGPGDSDADSFEIFRDGTPAGAGFLLPGMDFTAGTFSAFGFNVDKLVVWLNHNVGVQVDAAIYFCNYMHSEGANTNLQLSGQEVHISQSQLFGPRSAGTNLSITGGGNFSWIQSTMQNVSSGGTMVNIANNTCRDATIMIACGEGGSYNYTLAAGTKPFAAKVCDVSLNNYGSGVVTNGWVPSSQDFPGAAYPGVNYKLHFLSGPVQIQGGFTMWSTSGVPPAAMGVNGDACIRTDTPGTANQWLYKKSGGAWVGVL